MGVHYIELPDDGGRFGIYFRKVFGFLLHFQLWVFGIYVGLSVTWILLAAILNPEVYLAHGVAATCGIVIVTIAYKQLKAAAGTFRAVVSDALSEQMKDAMN